MNGPTYDNMFINVMILATLIDQFGEPSDESINKAADVIKSQLKGERGMIVDKLIDNKLKED